MLGPVDLHRAAWGGDQPNCSERVRGLESPGGGVNVIAIRGWDCNNSRMDRCGMTTLGVAIAVLVGGCEPAPSPQTGAGVSTAPSTLPSAAPTTLPATQPLSQDDMPRRTRLAADEGHQPTSPIDIPGVNNFAQVSPILYRGEQPTREGFLELKRRGIKTVINLRNHHSDEKFLVGTGLRYVRIKSTAVRIEDEDTLAFLAALHDPANQPVFVHCLHGSDRTGAAVAAYRIVEQGWTAEEAIRELRNFGHHEYFFGVRRYIRRLADRKADFARDRLPPPPKVKLFQ
jgi:tyrosine-protein phosphatase SIW14